MTTGEALAKFLPRGLYLPEALSAMSPGAAAVACSHWHEWADRRRWVFPFEIATPLLLAGESRFQREAFEQFTDALVAYFRAMGRSMEWMEGQKGGAA